jgi:hypothetical protein
MERRFESRNLRDAGQKRSENAQFLNLPLDLFVDDHRPMKSVPSVHDPMANSIDRSGNDSRPADLLEDGLERRPNAGHAFGLSRSRYPLGICFDRFRRDLEQIEFE